MTTEFLTKYACGDTIKDAMFPPLTHAVRLAYGRRVPQLGQAAVMSQTGLFHRASVDSTGKIPPPKPAGKDDITACVFNIERGETLPELIALLTEHPFFKEVDIILANELDYGCQRSGNYDVSCMIGQALNYYEVYALEFMELTNSNDLRGYHGNSIFSRWPIRSAKVIHLPEQYNWYDDAKQIRVGGRNAILAMIDTPKGTVGAVSTHFENRTDGAGRTAQMKYLFRKMSAYFPPDMPVIVGGDFNTNGFDGRDPLAKQAAWENQRAGGFLGELVKQEELFKIAKKHGYRWKETSKMAWSTRRVHLADDGTKAKDKHHSNILELHLDWLFARGLTPQDCDILETTLEAIRSDCGHPLLQKSKLYEVSDHNIVWASYNI
ncbi:MAG TPA: hypothetical protein GX717_06840 [Clostridiaceae bacterium]|nr:hypothetical protein [Clostridiaceae bacterium]